MFKVLRSNVTQLSSLCAPLQFRLESGERRVESCFLLSGSSRCDLYVAGVFCLQIQIEKGGNSWFPLPKWSENRQRLFVPLSLSQPHPPALFLSSQFAHCISEEIQTHLFPFRKNFFPTEAHFVDQSPSVVAAAALSSAVSALRDRSSNPVTLDKFNSRLSEVTGIPASTIKLCQDAQLIAIADTVATVTLRETKYPPLQHATSAPSQCLCAQGKSVINSYLDKPETPTDLQDVIFWIYIQQVALPPLPFHSTQIWHTGPI